MTSTNLLLLEQLLTWLEQDRNCWLCTVVATYGSSPRPVGSMMAFNNNGQLVGSLSGGCVEEDLIERVLSTGAGFGGVPDIVTYGVSAEQNERLGLPCGGTLKIIVESMRPGDGALEHITSLRDQVQLRLCVRREVDLHTGALNLQAGVAFEALAASDDWLRHTIGPQYQLLLIGAGELSRMLAQMALAFDYQIVVCDPRQQLIDDWTLQNVQLIQGMPDDVVRDYVKDEFSVVLALTHDPRIDDMGLMEALLSPAFYVGALGSSRTAEKRQARLQQLELPAAAIARLHAPVGLSIGAKSPAEIAVAILAELTQIRALQRQQHV